LFSLLIGYRGLRAKLLQSSTLFYITSYNSFAPSPHYTLKIIFFISLFFLKIDNQLTEKKMKKCGLFSLLPGAHKVT